MCECATPAHTTYTPGKYNLYNNLLGDSTPHPNLGIPVAAALEGTLQKEGEEGKTTLVVNQTVSIKATLSSRTFKACKGAQHSGK